MKIFYVLLGVCIAFLAVVVIQHLRYLSIRRNSAQDMQAPFHRRDVFHVITFFDIRDGEKILQATESYLRKIRGIGQSRLIYAGHAAFVLPAAQLGEQLWDGVFMHEYKSRAEYERVADQLKRRAAECFHDYHFHGMRRNRVFSLLIPVLLLRIRITALLRGKRRLPPLEHMPAFKKSSDYGLWRQRVARLRAHGKINSDGLVVFSLIKRGNAEQRKAHEVYSRQMMSRMSTMDHGPLHIGHAVGIQGNARFDDAYIVHYPSANYFADLLSSEFYQGIVQGKQVADTVVVPTIPITDQLLEALHDQV